MNNKIFIILSVVITISIIVYAVIELQTDERKISEQGMDNENKFQQSMDNAIAAKLAKIEENRESNFESEEPYIPAIRDWPTSGPFKIDRSQYHLGEKIFVNTDALKISEEGKINFYRPLNDTHHKKYYSMPFDGSKNRNNFYFTPEISIAKAICEKDDLIGTWKITFEGTNFSDLQFKIIDKIVPGEEDRFEKRC